MRKYADVFVQFDAYYPCDYKTSYYLLLAYSLCTLNRALELRSTTF